MGQVVVSGKVKDVDGFLPGASIIVKNTTIGVATDAEGYFILNNVPDGSQIIEISFIGHTNRQLKIDGNPGEDIKLGVIELEAGAMLDVVKVDGKMNEGERKALQMVKISPRILSVVSSEGIEKLPDRNAAEALQRMPGVVMESDQGEGRYISFRGTPTDWSSALVNGDRLPVASEEMEGRTMNFDILPTSFIEYIEYNQNLTPNIEGDAIGGSANFITKYTPQKKMLNLQAGYGWNFKANKALWNGSLQFGDRIGKNDRFGYVIGGSVYNRNWATDNFEVFYGNNDDHNIERLELRDYNGLRTTYGGNFKVDYRVSDVVEIYAQGFAGQLKDDEYNRKTLYDYAASVGQSIRLQNINNVMINRVYGGEAGVNFKWGDDSKLKMRIAHYDARFGYGNVPFTEGDPRNGYFVTEFEKQVEYTDYLYLDEDGNRLPYNERFNAYTRLRLLSIDSPYDDYGDDANNIQPRYNNIVGAGRPTDTLFQFKQAWTETLEHTERDPIVMAADWEQQLGKKFKLHMGAKFRTKEGVRTKGLETWNRSPDFPMAIVMDSFNLAPIPNKEQYLQEIGGHYQDDVFDFLTEDELNNFLKNNEHRLTYVALNPRINDLYEQFVGSNFTYTEDVISGYAMGTFTPSAKWSVNFGVRLENTNVAVTADTLTTEVNDIGETDFTIEKTTMERNYTAVLPMANVKYSLNEKSALRLSITRSFRRPNFNELKPGAPELHYSHFHVLYGNPNLRPTYSWNSDLSYQYFFGLEGMFTATAFYKYVTDHIYTSYNTEELVPRFNVTSKSFENAPYANVGGVEIVISRKLSFLPWIFKNLTTQLNYARTFSKMKIDAREELQPLPRQSANVANFQLGYEGEKFEATIGVNYKDPYLKELSFFAVRDPETNEFINLRTNNDFDIYQGKSLTMDASISYNINKKLMVYAEANNLFNTPFLEYRGKDERPIRTEYYSIRALFGIKYEIF
jgi:TonB-dependent receptor